MKYNTPAVGTQTINLAGGQAYQQTAKLEFVSILLTSFLKDQFYRTEAETVARLRTLLTQIDPLFAAKAAVYARNEFGMRSISHFVASEIGKTVKGQLWTKPFFARVVRRPDDALEILACYLSQYEKPLPNAMKRGLGIALSKMSEYSLAKYQKTRAELTMIDAVNLCFGTKTKPRARPGFVDRGLSIPLGKLLRGELAAPETWEVKLTQAGQNAEEGEVQAAKADEWKKLILEKKLGYMALVRNLRNILAACPEMTPQVCEQLVNREAIVKSLVFPFRFLTALDIVKEVGGAEASRVLAALSRAMELSVANVPKLSGKTLAVLDVSGSMTQSVTGKTSPARIGSLFAATLVKALSCDFMTFDGDARYVALNTADSVLSMAQSIPFPGGSTDFSAPMRCMNKAYDRIIILSDMQGWVGGGAPTGELSVYKQRFNADPKIYSFDLQGYGTMQFPQRNVYALAGFSDKIFSVMATLEGGDGDLLTAIDRIDFSLL
jgi:60 kDa SS-A/Ro ribonucleoprotein